MLQAGTWMAANYLWQAESRASADQTVCDSVQTITPGAGPSVQRPEIAATLIGRRGGDGGAKHRVFCQRDGIPTQTRRLTSPCLRRQLLQRGLRPLRRGRGLRPKEASRKCGGEDLKTV